MPTPKILLYVMNQKGYAVLKEIVEKHGPQVVAAVVVGKDEAVENDFSKEIIKFCKETKILSTDRQSDAPTAADYSMAVGWRWMLPTPKNLIVFHDSLLPRYRGFNPLVTALLNKDSEVGVSALLADGHEGYDTGPLIAQKSVKLKYPITIQQAIDLVVPLYCNIAVSLISQIKSGKKLKTKAQSEARATYSLWRDKLDYRINWNQTSEEILRHINAVGHPYAGALAFLNDEEIRILSAEVVQDRKIENRTIGKVFAIEEGCPLVVCKKGLLKVLKANFVESKKTALPLLKLKSRLT